MPKVILVCDENMRDENRVSELQAAMSFTPLAGSYVNRLVSREIFPSLRRLDGISGLCEALT